MIELVTHKDLSRCQSLPFCYLCGKEFSPEDQVNRDHVPPKAIFSLEDRANPLILPTHEKCNSDQSVPDEHISQLVSFLHGSGPTEAALRLDVEAAHVEGIEQPFGLLRGTDLDRIVWRWVKAFHAALYQRALDVQGKANIHVPFPRARKEDGKLLYERVLPQQRSIAEELKKSRLAKTLDRIECYCGKCIYECTWVTGDRGKQVCMLALKIYDWEKLAEPRVPASRGCVGIYQPVDGRPPNATKATKLELPPSPSHPLDPFG